jgi:FtsH-binding integral membrane protein
MKYIYNIFIVLAVLSTLLIIINRVHNYSINDWAISIVYILMWIFLFIYTVSKIPKKKKELKKYIPSAFVLLVVLLNIFDVIRRVLRDY